QAARDGMLEAEQLLVAARIGDVLADAAVAAETPELVEHRMAADADMAHLAAAVAALVDEVAKRLVCFEHRAMRGPLRFADAEHRQLPARLAMVGVGAQHRMQRRAAAARGEAEIGVL